MKLIFFGLFFSILSTQIPRENMKMGSPPDVSAARVGAAKLLDAIQSNDPQKAADFFFPKEAFDWVKDLPNPERYHNKLVGWYKEDIAKEHLRFKSQDWKLKDIELGRCKWKDIGTEGNKIAYWSCTRNFVTAVSGEKERRFEIRVLINWGTNWYVTHLGPIR